MNDTTPTDIIGTSLGIDFNFENTEIVEYKKTNIITKNDDSDAEFDYTTTREELHTLLENGNVALKQVLEFALTSGSPKAIEASTKLISVLAGVSKDLVGLHKDRTKKTDDGKTVNNNVFVGSTSELLDQINNT